MLAQQAVILQEDCHLAYRAKRGFPAVQPPTLPVGQVPIPLLVLNHALNVQQIVILELLPLHALVGQDIHSQVGH